MAWKDENNELPTKNGEYLCLVRWFGSDEYTYLVVQYSGFGWVLSSSYEHILWQELPKQI